MSDTPSIPIIESNKTGRPRKMRLNSLFQYIESLENYRENRETKVKLEINNMHNANFVAFEGKIKKKNR